MMARLEKTEGDGSEQGEKVRGKPEAVFLAGESR